MSHFEFYTPENANGEAARLLDEARQNFGFVPNMYAYMAEAPVTIEAYNTLNGLLEKTSFTPAQQQVALLAASVENQCHFCTTAHRAIGKMSKANQQTLDALGNEGRIEDDHDRALVHFVRAVVQQKGNVDDKQIAAFLEAGYTKQQVFEVIFIVSIKTLSNYVNHITHPEPNPELVAMV